MDVREFLRLGGSRRATSLNLSGEGHGSLARRYSPY